MNLILDTLVARVEFNEIDAESTQQIGVAWFRYNSYKYAVSALSASKHVLDLDQI